MKAGPSVERFQRVNQKLIARVEGQWVQGNVEASIPIPAEIRPGTYVVKLYASSPTQDAMAGASWILPHQSL